MVRSALVTGISGQDGSYLAELLLSKGYRVTGMVRRNSTPEHQTTRIGHLRDRIELVYGDVTDPGSCIRAVEMADPDEIYNLAGQSHVRVSSDVPYFTAQTNGVGVLNMLDAFHRVAPSARFYQASSSEMFGNSIDDDGYQRETTPMHPTSPYGCAKLYGYHITRHYRRAYGLFAVNGILFNHESPRRGANFVVPKIVKTAIAIQRGEANELRLGNTDSRRDWGDSRDYVRAMWTIMQQETPDDFVVATGENRSVRELCEIVFRELKLSLGHVVQDRRYMRPEELRELKGDASRIRELGWEPEYTFEQTLADIIEEYS